MKNSFSLKGKNYHKEVNFSLKNFFLDQRFRKSFPEDTFLLFYRLSWIWITVVLFSTKIKSYSMTSFKSWFAKFFHRTISVERWRARSLRHLVLGVWKASTFQKAAHTLFLSHTVLFNGIKANLDIPRSARKYTFLISSKS